ncbi:Uncharacterised protein [Mycobacterium tuberculosis]|uniref:Uncharacterized protein n=1 Tax=Mycobacterium tuberculosis TaxID=1773 RepID=A0A655ASU3_MYCTX|nr:Uncharacterised protein [Mycobacterium tuberculosis]CKP37780.1 Uncharacterised protein [Mycobacterium tuberculosis]CKP82525.1 Uncharacterised protein [Mycobacterium tuberculosis]CKS21013.1 Uncharacterised protein [Mycobacterium tuberculosis]CKT39346.1 Uncharacterised protein [Mycobacterium tuberculosis]
MTQHVDQELTVGAQTVQPGAYQRIGQHKRGLPAGGTVGDDLGQHWVVVDRHCGTVDDPGIQPDAGPLSQRVELRPNPRNLNRVHHACLWLPAMRGILGVEAGLDRISLGGGRFGVESPAVGNHELQFDQIQPGGLFGDRVLDL